MSTAQRLRWLGLTIAAVALTSTSFAVSQDADASGVQPRVHHFSLSSTSLRASGGTVKVTISVTNARSCALAVRPSISLHHRQFACASGTYHYSFSVPANSSLVTITYSVHLTVRGRSRSVVAPPKKISVATNNTAATTTIPSSTSTTSTTSTTSSVTTTTNPKTKGNTVPVPAQPDAMVLAGSNIWVASCKGNAVTEINRDSKQIVQTITNSTNGVNFNCPDALAFGDGYIWVANKLGNSLTQLNASTGTWIKTITGSDIVAPISLAIAGNDLWVGNFPNSNIPTFISEFNATTGDKIRTLTPSLGGPWDIGWPDCIVYTGTNIWISDHTGDSATEFSESTGNYLRHTQYTGAGGVGISDLGCVTYHSGYIWASGEDNGVIAEYNATTGVYVRSIQNLNNPDQLIFTGTDLFVILNTPTDTIREYSAGGIFIRTIATSSYRAGLGFSSILFDGTSLWSTNYTANTVTAHSL